MINFGEKTHAVLLHKTTIFKATHDFIQETAWPSTKGHKHF